MSNFWDYHRRITCTYCKGRGVILVPNHHKIPTVFTGEELPVNSPMMDCSYCKSKESN